jgi:hypothetical protein
MPCPSRQGLGYFYPSSLGDKTKPLMIIYSGVLFLNATWQLLPWQFCVFLICLQVSRSEEKKRKKERKFLVSFRIITCNLSFLIYVVGLDSLQFVIFFYS